MTKHFSIISAMFEKSKGIGFKNKLPWDIKKDIQRFKKISVGEKNKNAVIMGRKTWESLENKPLVDRLNIVLTKSSIPNVITSKSLDNALQYCYKNKDINHIYVIGGQNVYKEAINRNDCKYMFLTKIRTISELICDIHFPDIPQWIVKKEEEMINVDNKTLLFEKWENVSNDYSEENQYIDLIKDIIENGEKVQTRNGIVRKSFGQQNIFDLQKGFPLLTTKKMFFDGIIKELLFFIKGETNTNILTNQDVHIWEKNTSLEFLKERNLSYPKGDMGPMYGFNWRYFGAKYINCFYNYKHTGYDQLYYLVKSLLTKKHDRRHLLTTYDPANVSKSVLAPCHGIVVQFYISNKNNEDYLHCKMYQRSVDIALGYPFNIASYALLVHLLCHITGYKPGKLIMTLGDTHIYEQHIIPLLEQINNKPIQFPNIEIDKKINYDNVDYFIDKEKFLLHFLENIQPKDIVLKDYHPWPSIKIEMVA